MSNELPVPPIDEQVDCRDERFPIHELINAMFGDEIGSERRAELVKLARSMSPSGIIERH